jgi:hypothetical protein
MEFVEEGRHARLRLLEGRQLCRGLQRHGALTEMGGVGKWGRSATDYAADCAAARVVVVVSILQQRLSLDRERR